MPILDRAQAPHPTRDSYRHKVEKNRAVRRLDTPSNPPAADIGY
jgi:hypothetical protein